MTYSDLFENRSMSVEIGFWEHIKLRIYSFIKRKIHQYKYWDKNPTDTNLSFGPQTSGEASYIWWHEWEDEEKVHESKNDVSEGK